QILGSHEGIFPPHSSATGRKNGKVRFQKLAFAAKMTTSKHALTYMEIFKYIAIPGRAVVSIYFHVFPYLSPGTYTHENDLVRPFFSLSLCCFRVPASQANVINPALF
ncbi:MAG: hypothetical protein J5I98_32880, partial [Phaeodactylibacter sp.]|nr:hypothetical protein [Phaeodactylibacter sp.]